MNPDPLKRVCDHFKYKILPCETGEVLLDEYFDTMLRPPRSGWGYLCRLCTQKYGYPASAYTTHFVWDDEAGCYLKQKKRRASNADNL